MIFNVDFRDVRIYSGASHGFRDFYDEDGVESWKSKKITDETWKEANEWTKPWLNKIYKSDTLAEFIKGIPSYVPYSLELKDNEIIFDWSCPNRLNGEYTFGFEIIYANIS